MLENPKLVARMAGELVRPEDGKFAALAGAFSQNGVVLYVPKGVKIEEPLNSLSMGTRRRPGIYFPPARMGGRRRIGDVHPRGRFTE